MRHVRRVIGALAGLIACSVLIGAVVAAGAVPFLGVGARAADAGLSAFTALPTALSIPTLDQATRVYALKDGRPVQIADFYAQDRVVARWPQISATVKDAVLAAEDPGFYHEGAVSVRGTVRAAVATLFGNDLQGGSTITQQYVKNVRTQQCTQQYTPAPGASARQVRSLQAEADACRRKAEGVTLGRKVQELRYALALEKKYSKKQILLGYLNIAFFGGRTYGIQAAARYYFGTDAAHLGIGQAAVLAAMINEPSVMRIDQSARANPANNAGNGFAVTRARRDYVLARMLGHGMITRQDYASAVAAPIRPKITPVHSGCYAARRYDAGFFCSYAEDQLAADPGLGATAAARWRRLSRGGLKVYTSLDLDLQKSAQDALSDYVPATKPGIDLGGAQVAVRPGSGRIVSMVQNRAYDDRSDPPPGTTSVNYATDFDAGGSAGFQTGSSFKPFVLAAWLEAGHTLGEEVDASRHYFPAQAFHSSCSSGWSDWQVKNAEPWEGGVMSVLQATEESVNTAYAQMESSLDLCDVTGVAQALQVHSASPATNPWVTEPSMVLGSNYVSPLAMATAYAAFADGGVVCTPVAITRIVGPHGAAIPAPATHCTQALPAAVADTVAYALQKVLTDPAGTAYTADPHDGVPILAKTGTTDHGHENWLVTATTNVASALWIGNVTGQADMLDMAFRNRGSGPVLNGMTVKFAVGKRLLHAIDEEYGGAAFPAADPQMIGGPPEDSAPPASSAPPTASTSPAPPASSTPPTPSTPPAGPTPSPPQAPDGAGRAAPSTMAG